MMSRTFLGAVSLTLGLNGLDREYDAILCLKAGFCLRLNRIRIFASWILCSEKITTVLDRDRWRS